MTAVPDRWRSRAGQRNRFRTEFGLQADAFRDTRGASDGAPLSFFGRWRVWRCGAVAAGRAGRGGVGRGGAARAGRGGVARGGAAARARRVGAARRCGPVAAACAARRPGAGRRGARSREASCRRCRLEAAWRPRHPPEVRWWPAAAWRLADSAGPAAGLRTRASRNRWRSSSGCRAR